MNSSYKRQPKFQKLFLIGILTFLSISCMFREGIRGNGIVEKETRNVTAFNQLDISGAFNVYLSQGEKESVTIEADNNLIPIIKTVIDENKLYVDVEKGFNIGKSKKCNVYITVKDINNLNFNGVGNLKCLTDLNLSNIDIHNSGVGNVELKGNVQECSIHNSGVGNINAFDFVAQKMNLNNSGVGNVEINVAEELSISNSGVGNVSYKGNASINNVNSSGVGKIIKK